MFMVPNCITMSNMTSSTSWLIDSGAGLSGTNNRNLLSCPSSCRVPITPAFGEMITATSEGSIRDHQLGQLNIRALHVEKMHHNLLSVHQLCEGGDSRTKQIGVFTDPRRMQILPAGSLSRCFEASIIQASNFLWTGQEWSVRVCPI